MSKLTKLILSGGLFFLFLLLLIPITVGAKATYGQQNISIGKDEIIDYNFIATAKVINLSGQFTKDVIIAAGSVTIDGNVGGDIIAIASDIKINGKVDGNARIVGGTVEINGKVGKNVTIVGGNLILGPNAEVGWDAMMVSDNADIKGKIKGDLKGFGGNFLIANEISGNVDLKQYNQGLLTLTPQTLIGGNLNYRAVQPAAIEKSQVKGEIVYAASESAHKNAFNATSFFTFLVSLFSALVIGMIIIILTPQFITTVTGRMREKPLISLGRGLIYFIIIPIILVLLMFTVIGIPLAIIGGGLYFLVIYLSKIFVSVIVGEKAINYYYARKAKSATETMAEPQKTSAIKTMILGVVIFMLLGTLPAIGGLIKFLGVLWFLGAFGKIAMEWVDSITRTQEQ